MSVGGVWSIWGWLVLSDRYINVKRLLGLAYFWAGSINAFQMRLWATWIMTRC
jgi:hypothetical protein